MWMMPLHLHVNQKSNNNDDDVYAWTWYLKYTRSWLLHFTTADLFIIHIWLGPGTRNLMKTSNHLLIVKQQQI